MQKQGIGISQSVTVLLTRLEIIINLVGVDSHQIEAPNAENAHTPFDLVI